MSEKTIATPVEMVTWINADHPHEPTRRKMGRRTLRPLIEEPDFQTYIPVQDIETLRETNPKLAGILHEQIELRRSSATYTHIPVVEQNGDIKLSWTIPTEPLNVRFTSTGIVQLSSD